MTNMMNGWNIVFLLFALHASAQVSRECARPSAYMYTELDKKYTARQKFSHGEKVYYDCAEGFTASRGSRAVQCLNGKWTALTLKCEKKSCGNAGDLLNGQLIYEGNSVLGDKVYAVCNDGYTLKGTKYMICKSTGWTGEFPLCEEGGAVAAAEATCSNPAVTNGVKSSGDAAVHQVGDSVTFTCNQGFQLDGSQQVTCGPGGQWQPQLPLCLPSNDITCDKPKAHPQNKFTVITGLKPVYKHGDSLSFSCNRPYRLNGSATATCGLNGKWTPPLPKCTWPKCPELKIAHGALSNKRSRINSVVIVRCLRGYRQEGPSRVICLKDGKWTAIPECVSEKGAETTCSNPAVANGVKSSGDAAVHRVGQTVTFTCNQGFQLDGSQQVTCGPGGQWQPQLPRCLPSSGTCGVPVTINKSNAHLADSYITMTSFSSGDQVRYMCEVGYAQVGGSGYRRCNNGQWTPLLMRCERKSCGSAGEIINGEFMYTGAEFGDTARALCDEGYRLVGQGRRTCMSDGWDGRVPTCEAVQCADPPEVANSQRTGTQDAPYVYNSVVGYRCQVGTLIGQREIWCTKDGTWSSPPPECKEMICPPPNVSNASWMWKSTPYQYRDIVSFECGWGYEMVGTSSVTCGANGEWIPALPKCISRGMY
ncbi:complement receptor type 2 [Centroberyx gerrardi]|uniref:complement receptor type 2 n=1 Tax=Centroberyx gerrardi TaxID=166262 RepID=UPI003AAFDB7A